MDAASIKRLNELNRAFYALTVADFDELRGRPWPGWQRLLPHLATLSSPLRALDAGCGNGRFGRFLARNLSAEVRYHGVDFSPALLDAASSAFARMGILPGAVLEVRDMVADSLPQGEYSLVAAFGLLHHVPGGEQRRLLIQSLAERVAPGGLLVFTGWRFHEYERFRENRPLVRRRGARAGRFPARLAARPRGEYGAALLPLCRRRRTRRARRRQRP